jgi:hypothetical protein
MGIMPPEAIFLEPSGEDALVKRMRYRFYALWYAHTHEGHPLYWTNRIQRQSRLAQLLMRIAMWIDGVHPYTKYARAWSPIGGNDGSTEST